MTLFCYCWLLWYFQVNVWKIISQGQAREICVLIKKCEKSLSCGQHFLYLLSWQNTLWLKCACENNESYFTENKDINEFMDSSICTWDFQFQVLVSNKINVTCSFYKFVMAKWVMTFCEGCFTYFGVANSILLVFWAGLRKCE